MILPCKKNWWCFYQLSVTLRWKANSIQRDEPMTHSWENPPLTLCAAGSHQTLASVQAQCFPTQGRCDFRLQRRHKSADESQDCCFPFYQQTGCASVEASKNLISKQKKWDLVRTPCPVWELFPTFSRFYDPVPYKDMISRWWTDHQLMMNWCRANDELMMDWWWINELLMSWWHSDDVAMINWWW